MRGSIDTLERMSVLEIVVIGPNPSCIRCETTLKRAQSAAASFVDESVGVMKVFSRTEDAEKYGKVESGHEIETIGNVEPDRAKMDLIWEELDRLDADDESNADRIDTLLKELDLAIAAVRQRAEELGYLMTPVLVVNGKVKSAGYTPGEEEIRRWIKVELAE